MKICPVGPEEVVVQNYMSPLTFSGKKRSFLRFWQCVKIHFFEKFTFPTLWQGSSLVVARPTDMKICPAGPEEVVVQNDMSRLTFSGKKRSFLRFWQCVEILFFWEIYISYAQTGVEFGCRATDKHDNLSGRPGGSRRTEWHVAIDILGQKKVIFEILTMRRNSFFLRNLHFLRSDRGRVWLSRDPQTWKFVR